MELIEFPARNQMVISSDNSQGESDGSLTTEKVFLTYADLHKATGISVRTLYQYATEGKITGMKFGRLVRFDREETLAKLRKLGRKNFVQTS